MSVLINMEMPTRCGRCDMRISAYDDGMFDHYECCITAAIIDNLGEKMEDCPLAPVPKHGDLIERNKLYEKTAEWEAQALHMVEVTMHDEDTTEWRKWSTVLTERSAFKFDVADAPTIIPASGGNKDE